MMYFLVLLLVVWGWFMFCNHQTCKQKIALISLRPHGEWYWLFVKEQDAVTYDQHLLALLTFSDPIKLYGPLTQKAWMNR